MSYNVNRSITDDHYRYKMPKLEVKIEGRGNGIKTVLVNIVDVAKALERPPAYICKFFGCELGAQTQSDGKNDRYIVNGLHERETFQRLLDVFVGKFVLCTNCKNPETDLVVKKRGTVIDQICKACGHQGTVDMSHRLTTFILKYPPNGNNVKGDPLTKKKDRKKEKQNNEVRSDDDNYHDEDWAVDVSKEAVEERASVLSLSAKNLIASNDEKSQVERLENFYEYVKEQKEKGRLKPDAKVSVFRGIEAEAKILDVKEDKGVAVIAELLLDENIIKQLSQYRIQFLLFTHNNLKSQKHLLCTVEKIVERYKELLLPKISTILKSLYDHDIVEEEVFLDWGQRSKTGADIRSKAAPFLKWLREAEEETADEGEEKEEEEESVADVRINSFIFCSQWWLLNHYIHSSIRYYL